MIVTSIEQICPLDREWLEQCQYLRGAESLPAMVWISLQMCLLIARGIIEAELKRRSNLAVEWPKCEECGRKMQSKGWRTRQMETIVGIIH
jgi:hypothetical protein